MKQELSFARFLGTVLLAWVLATPMAAQSFCEPPNGQTSVADLLYARPFVLERGYASHWQKERPIVTSGFLVVLRVDPALAMPRAGRMPILYAGDRVLERISSGYPSGYLVGIVPDRIDLYDTPIWFGEPGYPSAVDVSTIQANLARSREAGIGPLPKNRVTIALMEGGSVLSAPDRSALLERAIELAQRYRQ